LRNREVRQVHGMAVWRIDFAQEQSQTPSQTACASTTRAHNPKTLPNARELLKLNARERSEVESDAFCRGLPRPEDLDLAQVRVATVLVARSDDDLDQVRTQHLLLGSTRQHERNQKSFTKLNASKPRIGTESKISGKNGAFADKNRSTKET